MPEPSALKVDSDQTKAFDVEYVDQVVQRRLVKPGGKVVVFENYYDGMAMDDLPGRIIYELTRSRLLSPFTARLGANTARVGVTFHSAKTWRRLVESAGFKVDHAEICYPYGTLNALKRAILHIAPPTWVRWWRAQSETQPMRSPNPSHAPRSAPWMLLILLLMPLSAWATPWAEAKGPSAGLAKVIGGPSNGCIAGADALPETGKGFVSVRRYRNRFYGHPDLLALVKEMGLAQARRGNGLMMVGDLSQPRGGRMPSSHRSHQNGLDGDIWFTLADSPQAARRVMDNKSDPISMVQPGGLFTSDAWGAGPRALIETAARHPSVDRIFANPAIKRALCKEVQGDRAWLRKVRPWFGHDSHFHVRLRCPPGSAQCKGQEPLPSGDGCGADLAWWFTHEARSPFKKKDKAKPAPAPQPPAACMQVLTSR